MKKHLTWLIGLPVGIAIVALSVANRAPVTISLDPFSADAPALSFSLPLYQVFFATLVAGVLLGGFAVWAKQGKWRRKARDEKYEAAKWRAEAERQTGRVNDLTRVAQDQGGAALPAPGRRDAA